MASKLQASSNYDLFAMSGFNRDVKKTKSLVDSMRKHGFIPAYPLHCVRGENGKLIVKAGHHRFESAKSLGIAVQYIVCDDAATIHELEKATTQWKFSDYVLSHARAGSECCMLIREMHEASGVSMAQLASMLAGRSASSNNGSAAIKAGVSSSVGIAHAKAVCGVATMLRNAGVKFAANNNLVSAISHCVWLKEFSVDTFLHRVATNLHMLQKQATMNQYLDLIDKVYNHSAKTKVALAFLAKEAAKKRSAVSGE